MTAIGIDTHKATLAACAVDGLGLALDERTFRNDPAGHRALAVWATEVAAGGPIGIEGSSTYGAALARFLVAAALLSARCHRSSPAGLGSRAVARARAIRAMPSRSPG